MKNLELIAAVSEITGFAFALYWYDWKLATILFFILLSQNLSIRNKINSQ